MSNYYIPEHDIVFIHIPKTGGSSIRDGIFGGKWEQSFGERRFNFKTFAFVREPADRFCSCLAYLRKNGYTLTVKQALHLASDEGIPHGNKGYLPWAKHHLLPMTHPYNNIHNADYIGRFEEYEKDVQRILGKAAPPSIPHLNKAEGAGIKLDEDELSFVQKVYERDYNLFY